MDCSTSSTILQRTRENQLISDFPFALYLSLSFFLFLSLFLSFDLSLFLSLRFRSFPAKPITRLRSLRLFSPFLVSSVANLRILRILLEKSFLRLGRTQIASTPRQCSVFLLERSYSPVWLSSYEVRLPVKFHFGEQQSCN